jgi:hypothetical protein
VAAAFVAKTKWGGLHASLEWRLTSLALRSSGRFVQVRQNAQCASRRSGIVKLRLVVCSLVALVLCASASAVTGGTIDGPAHPATGLLVAGTPGSLQPQCSGTLISPTVFLTAGHCTADLPSNRVYVTFDAAYVPSSPLVAGTATTDPLYGVDKKDSHDVAVVVFDAPVRGIAPVPLARAGALDSPPASVVAVGYGADQPAQSKKNLTFSYDFVRRFGNLEVEGVSKTELRTSSRDTGTCYGDSGGPELSGSTLVAVISHGDTTCSKRAFGYRIDTASAREFLGRFLALP